MKPLISVVIPVYNAEQTLPRCVDSILAQTYGNIEVILVDDGSADGSGAICTRYAEAHDNITAILQKNGGVSAARNAGISVARGDYLGFVDSDDWIEPEMYQGLFAAMTEQAAQISACGYRIHRFDGVVYDHMVDSSTPPRLELDKALRSLIDPRGIQGFLCNKLFDRALLTQLGGGAAMLLDERIYVCEDLLYVSRCIEAVGTVAYDSRPMYVYCVQDYGGAENYNRERRSSELIALDQLVEAWNRISPELGDRMKRKHTVDTYHIIRAAAAAKDRDYIPVLKEQLRRFLTGYLRDGQVPVGRKARVIVALVLPNLENRLKALIRR